MAKPAADTSGQWSEKQRKRIFFVAFAVIFLVLGYWNYTTFVGDIFDANPDSADCISRMATITDVHSGGGTSRNKSRDSYFVSYSYEVDGKDYEGKERVDDNVYSRSKVGGELEICSMKDHPDRSAVVGNDIKGQDAFFVVLVDIGAIALILFVIYTGIRKKKTKGVAA